MHIYVYKGICVVVTHTFCKEPNIDVGSAVMLNNRIFKLKKKNVVCINITHVNMHKQLVKSSGNSCDVVFPRHTAEPREHMIPKMRKSNSDLFVT